jgi:hypothetical protein
VVREVHVMAHRIGRAKHSSQARIALPFAFAGARDAREDRLLLAFEP